MAIFHGLNGKVDVGGNTVAGAQDWSYSVNPRLEEGTSMGDSSPVYVSSSLLDATGTIGTLIDYADTTGQGALAAGDTVTLTLYPDGDASGKTQLSGSVVIGEVTVAGSATGIPTKSANFRGLLTESTVA